MDVHDFDILVRRLAAAHPRRTVLRVLAALPLVGGISTPLADETDAHGRRKRRKKRHQHHAGDGKDNRNGKRNGKHHHKAPQTSPPPTSPPSSPPSPPPPPPPCTGLKPTGSGPTQGLQEAIDAAALDATLSLCPGTWAITDTVTISQNLTLAGSGAGQTILDGGNTVRVLQINPSVTVTVRDLTVTKGNATGLGFIGGGGIYNNQATLTLVGVSVTNSTALGGGGITNNGGTLTLGPGTSIAGNTAPTSNGAGGGVLNQLGTMTMQAGSSVTDNTADDRGGGIRANGGTMTLQAGSSVTGNHADPTDPDSGGGIYQGGGTVNLDPGSTVSGNTPDNCSPTIGTCT